MLNQRHYLQDGSYVRLKNISLSYTFTRKMIGFGDIRLSVSAQNALTITKYKGFDPEADTMGNSDISQPELIWELILTHALLPLV